MYISVMIYVSCKQKKVKKILMLYIMTSPRLNALSKFKVI